MKTKGIYFLYRVLLVFGLPILLLYFLSRGLRNRAYWRSLPQRFGFLPRSFRQTGPGAIWLHAVSVGEVLACAEALRGIRAAFPRTAVFVSTMTLAGRATAGDKLTGLVDGVFYAPVDYVFAVRQVLRALRPSVIVIAETEIWPTLIREAKRTGAGVTIVNGRISDRALPRYLRFRWFFRAVLPSVDSTLAQTEDMRARFLSLGAPAERVRVSGNLKYDFEARPAAPGSPVMEFLERARPAKVWIAASTMAPAEAGDVDEDDAALAAHREIASRHPDWMLILAPRKPERFEVVARKIEAAGIGYARRTRLEDLRKGGAGAFACQPASSQLPAPPPILLLDTIGELGGLFAAADAVFMGGTLARRGGHNILEPALFAKPVVAGPHMENFQAIADDFRAAGACIGIARTAELAGAVTHLLEDPAAAREIGRRALACAEARRGAAARAVAEVTELHTSGVPRYLPPAPWLAIAWTLSRLWEWGARRRRRRDLARQRKLDVPVISVGNIAMGGTGKTPCVLRLAALLRERGFSPGILTRGYGRSSPQEELAVAAGAAVSVEISGDEPQILVRSGVAPVGIGGDRFQAGQLLRREFGVNALVLDDGFQHARLARDVDIVLIDALDPFGAVFPLGRLREPLSAISRAHIVVIARSAFSDLGAAIERAVRQFNSRAPIFRAGIQPLAWVEHGSGARHRPEAPPFERAGVVCGLGNPHAFRRTLEGLGVSPAGWLDFEDHHRYRPHELRRIAHQLQALGATAIVTTEKDAVNLCQGWRELIAPLPLYWLQIEMRIGRESEFATEIERRLASASVDKRGAGHGADPHWR
ncbi:MAG: tetraacyldisaccharide 4'-kinase [Bryobacteraceae bacterium]